MRTQAAPSGVDRRATLQAGGRYGTLGLTGLEIAVAQAYGEAPAGPLPAVQGDPGRVLEEVLVEVLRRPPVVVAFSGGRDSSALLALAARAARRAGLDPPVAATNRFPAFAETQEAEWQELVIGRLGVRDWEIVEPGETLDVVGPVAAAALVRHGPLSPPNAHFVVPLAELARGGTLLTGVDGDLLFGGWRWARLGALARGRARPVRRDARQAAHLLAPLAAQRRRAAATSRLPLHWLAPAAREAIAEIRARHALVQPRRFDRFVAWAARRRHLALAARQLDLLGAGVGARIASPFLDDRFLAAYAARGGARGLGDRTATMRTLFGDALPEALLSRPTKASFEGAFLGEAARAFAARWDGTGLDPDLVNADALREDWRGPAISYRSAGLLQWLWLRERGV